MPFARRQRPRGVDLAADEVQIVEDLRWLRIPRRARRRLARVRHIGRRNVAEVLASARRKQARARERAQKFEFGRGLCGLLRGFYLFRQVWFRRRLCLLRKGAASDCCETKNESDKWNEDEVPCKLPPMRWPRRVEVAGSKSIPNFARKGMANHLGHLR